MKEWDKGPPVIAGLSWYTDDSQTEYYVRAGIYGRKTRKALSIPSLRTGGIGHG